MEPLPTLFCSRPGLVEKLVNGGGGKVSTEGEIWLWPYDTIPVHTLLPTGLARLTNWQTWGGPGRRVGCTIKPRRENTDREALMKPIPAALLPNRNELSVTQSLFESREMMCSLFPNQLFLTAPGLSTAWHPLLGRPHAVSRCQGCLEKQVGNCSHKSLL